MSAKKRVIRTTALLAGAVGVLLVSAAPASAHMGIAGPKPLISNTDQSIGQRHQIHP